MKIDYITGIDPVCVKVTLSREDIMELLLKLDTPQCNPLLVLAANGQALLVAATE